MHQNMPQPVTKVQFSRFNNHIFDHSSPQNFDSPTKGYIPPMNNFFVTTQEAPRLADLDQKSFDILRNHMRTQMIKTQHQSREPSPDMSLMSPQILNFTQSPVNSNKASPFNLIRGSTNDGILPADKLHYQQQPSLKQGRTQQSGKQNMEKRPNLQEQTETSMAEEEIMKVINFSPQTTFRGLSQYHNFDRVRNSCQLPVQYQMPFYSGNQVYLPQIHPMYQLPYPYPQHPFNFVSPQQYTDFLPGIQQPMNPYQMDPQAAEPMQPVFNNDSEKSPDLSTATQNLKIIVSKKRDSTLQQEASEERGPQEEISERKEATNEGARAAAGVEQPEAAILVQEEENTALDEPSVAITTKDDIQLLPHTQMLKTPTLFEKPPGAEKVPDPHPAQQSERSESILIEEIKSRLKKLRQLKDRNENLPAFEKELEDIEKPKAKEVKLKQAQAELLIEDEELNVEINTHESCSSSLDKTIGEPTPEQEEMQAQIPVGPLEKKEVERNPTAPIVLHDFKEQVRTEQDSDPSMNLHVADITPQPKKNSANDFSFQGRGPANFGDFKARSKFYGKDLASEIYGSREYDDGMSYDLDKPRQIVLTQNDEEDHFSLIDEENSSNSQEEEDSVLDISESSSSDSVSYSQLSLSSNETYIKKLKNELERDKVDKYQKRMSILKKMNKWKQIEEANITNLQNTLQIYSKLYRGRKEFNKPTDRLDFEEYEAMYGEVSEVSSWPAFQREEDEKLKFRYTFGSNLVQNLDQKFGQLLINKEILRQKIKLKQPGDQLISCLIGVKKARNLSSLFQRQTKLDMYHKSELSEKLVETYDLDLSKIEDPFSIYKIQRVDRWLEEQQETEDKQLQQIRNSAAYKIEKHLHKRRDGLLMDPETRLSELDGILVSRNRENNILIQQYKTQRTKKRQRKAMIIKSEQSFIQNSYYEDLMWRHKLNKKMFIEIEDEQIIDSLCYPERLFAIKLRLTHMGLLSEIDWAAVTSRSKKHEMIVNRMKNSREGRALVKSIEMSENMRLWLLISFSNAKKYNKIRNFILPIMEAKIIQKPRLILMQFKYKMRSGMELDHMNSAKQRIFDSRFYYMIKKYNFRGYYHQITTKEMKITQRETKKGPNFAYRDSHVFRLIDGDSFSRINNYIFNMLDQNIFMKLYRQEHDLIAHMLVKKLGKYLLGQYKDKKAKKEHVVPVQWQEITPSLRRAMTLQKLPQGSQREHDRMIFRDFRHDLQNKNVIQQSVDGEVMKKGIEKFRRQGALDEYNLQKQDLIIQKELQKNILQTRDSKAPFFSKVASIALRCCDSSQSKYFGYKCKMVRDLDYPMCSMEIMLPTEIHKATAKLRKYEQKMRRMPVLNEERKWVRKANALMENPSAKFDSYISKELKAVQVPDILTDESLKGIELEDISSHGSDEDHSNMFKLVRNTYDINELNKQKEQRAKAERKAKHLEVTQKYNAIAYYRNLFRTSLPAEVLKKKRGFRVVCEDDLTDQQMTVQKKSVLSNVRQVLGKTLYEVNHDNLDQLLKIRKGLDYFEVVKKHSTHAEDNMNHFFRESKIKKLHGKNSLQEQASYNISGFIQHQIEFPQITEESPVSFRRKTVMKNSTPDVRRNRKTLKMTKIQSSFAIDNEKLMPRNSISPTLELSQLRSEISKINQANSRNSPSRDLSQTSKKSAQAVINPNFRQRNKNNLERDIFMLAHRYSCSQLENVFNFNEMYFEEQQKLLLENELKLMKEIQQRKSKMSKKDQKVLVNRLKILAKIYQNGQRKAGQMEDPDQVDNHVLLSNNRIKKKMTNLITRYNLKLNLKLPQKRKLTRTMTKQELEELHNKSITYDHRFKAKLYKIIKNKNVNHMEDIYKRYYVTAENTSNHEGNSLLALAVQQDDEKMMELLINRGMNLNQQNYDGNTALHYAVSMKNMKAGDLLLKNGADEDIRNNLGLRCWDLLLK